MKKLLLAVCSVLIITGVAFAETYVLYNNTTKEVYSISNEDDAVMPQGYAKVVIKENMKDLDLDYPADCYKWQNNRFVSNTKKLDALAQKEELARNKAEEEKLIQKKLKKIAIDKLKEEGVILKYIEE